LASHAASTDASGFYVAVRRPENLNTTLEMQLFRNNVRVANGNVTEPNPLVENSEFWACAANADANNNRLYSNKPVGMVFAGEAVSDTDIGNFYSRVQTLVAALAA
jgi:hypothetical protein